MARIYIETYGCTFNQAESIYMGNKLRAVHEIVNKPEEADLVIINSCTVKQEAETKLYRALRRYKDKKIIVAGCVPQADPELKNTKLRDYSIIGPGAINRIVEAVEKTLRGERFVDLSNHRPIRLGESLRKNKIIEMIPINDGCLANCYFCKTKQSRGDLYSYPLKLILNHVDLAIRNDAKELWITSQDSGAYGLDIGIDLSLLIKKILEEHRDKFYWIRIGMMNPNHAYRMRKQLGELYKDPHLYKFLHISVQSGSDKVLKEMNRPHNVRHYVESVEYYRSIIPEMTIATDIIVGYPTETDEDFELTLKLVEKTRPNIVNISRFWPRPGTIAANMKQLPFKIIKKRLEQLHLVVDEILEKENSKWIDWEGIVLIDEYGKNGSLKARNYAYKQVVIEKEEVEKTGIAIGDLVEVKITNSTKHHIIGKPLGIIEKNK